MNKIYLIIGASVLGIALLSFAGYKLLASKKGTDSYATTGWHYDSIADCVKDYQKAGEDPSVANDTCINLESQAKMAASNETQKSTTTPAATASITTASSSSSCNAALPDAKGAFTELPFDVSHIKLVTLGKETNDPRFVYPWVKNDKANIYAPADGVLYMLRHKVFEVAGQKGNDYDLFFKVDCGTVYRFNHISDPRADIKAAYAAGDLPSGDYANGGTDIPERVKPKTAIKVKAGEPLGSTTGVPGAKDFDFAVGVAKEAPNDGEPLSVCPFSVFNEPHKTTLMNLLGPKSGSPTPGYPCDVPSMKF